MRARIREAASTLTAERLLLLALGLLVLAAGLGLRDPWPADEPRFALIARDMVTSGDWLIPHIGGVPYSDKPPLFMWLTAAFYWLTGELRVAFLLPSLLAGLGMLALVHDLARRLWSRQVALYAGLLLLLSVQFTLQARSAQLDALVSFWITLGLYGLIRHLLLGPSWGWYFIAWFAMGLGVITKGVGFLPVLLFLPWAVLRYRWPQNAPVPAGPAWRWGAGPAAMLAAIGLWLVPMLIHVGMSGSPELAAYRDDILLRQTAGRYAASWDHLRPVWFYLLEVLPWAWLPLTVALPWLLPPWWRRLRTGEPAAWLLLGWVACVLVFFSASPGKRGVYMLPTVPAIVLSAAPMLPDLVRRTAIRRAAFALVALVALVAVASTAALVAMVGFMPARAAELAGKHGVAPWGLLAAVAVLAAGACLYGRRGRGVAALTLLLVGVWQLHGWWGYPLFNASRSGADVMTAATGELGAGEVLGLVDWEEQFLLHAGRPVYHFGFRRPLQAQREDAIAWLAGAPNRRLLIAQEQMGPCLDPALARPLVYRHRRQWVLAGPEAIGPSCRPASAPVQVRLYDPGFGRE